MSFLFQLALSLPIAELKAVGSPYWEYFLYYLNVWRNDWNCIYYGHLKHDYICKYARKVRYDIQTKLNVLAEHLCQYGDCCCKSISVCENVRFNFSCSCPNEVPYEFSTCCKLPETTPMIETASTETTPMIETASTDTTPMIETASTEKPCPYEGFDSSTILCDLWKEENECTASGTPSETVPYTSCPYLNESDSNLACKLWCDTQLECNGKECSGAPICPYENFTTPYDEIACNLWAQLNDASGSSELGSEEEFVTCIYLDSPSYSMELCDLWCQLYALKYGKTCANVTLETPYPVNITSTTTPSPPCPYLGMANEQVLCDLWEQINAAEASGLSPGGSGTVPYDDCPYKDQPNGILACELWCQLQELTTGSVCEGAPTCPYENYTAPDNDILCQLWSENVWLNGELAGSGSDAQTAPVYGGSGGGQTVTCPHVDPYASEKCMLWCENQELGFGNICSISTTAVPTCPYSGKVNDETLCDLWTNITEAKAGSEMEMGSGSVPYDSCPYISIENGPLACELWCELQEVTDGTTCSDQPTCPYFAYDEYVLLCQQYTSILEAEGSGSDDPQGSGYTGTFNESGCPYLDLTDGTLICDLWCQLINLVEGLTCSEPIDVLELTSTTSTIMVNIVFQHKIINRRTQNILLKYFPDSMLCS